MILLKLVAVTLAVVYSVECNTVTTPSPEEILAWSQVNHTANAIVPKLRINREARRGSGRFNRRRFNNFGGSGGLGLLSGGGGGGLGMLGGGLGGLGGGGGGLGLLGGGGGQGIFGGGGQGIFPGGGGRFGSRGRNRNNVAVSNQNVNANAGDFGTAIASGVSNAIA